MYYVNVNQDGLILSCHEHVLSPYLYAKIVQPPQEPLLSPNGIPLYKLVDGAVTERTAAEIETDVAALPAPEPTPQEQTDALMLDHEERLIYLELGANE